MYVSDAYVRVCAPYVWSPPGGFHSSAMCVVVVPKFEWFVELRLLCAPRYCRMDRKMYPMCSRALDLHYDAESIACARTLAPRTRAEKPRRTVQAPAH